MASRTRKRCGVYAIHGPAGVYVGSSVDCDARNDKITKLGLKWEIIHPMRAGAPLRERIVMEMAIAEDLETQGYTVVSKNSRRAYAEQQRHRSSAWKTKYQATCANRTPEQRAAVGLAISRAKKGKPRKRSSWDDRGSAKLRMVS